MVSAESKMSLSQTLSEYKGKNLTDLGYDVRFLSLKISTLYLVASRIIDATAGCARQPAVERCWDSPASQVMERDDRLYARSAGAGKGGIITILIAPRAYQKSKRNIPSNVIILFEWEKEYGLSCIGNLLELEAECLHAYALDVLEGINRDLLEKSTASFTRSILDISLEVVALAESQQSEIDCLEPCHILSIAVRISTLRNPITIPGYIDEAETLTDEQRLIYRLYRYLRVL